LETQASQQRQEKEDASDPTTPGVTGCQIQCATVGDFGELWTTSVFARFPASGTSGSIANEKGGGLPAWHPLRNRDTNDRRAKGRYPKRSATWSNGRRSMKIARRASVRSLTNIRPRKSAFIAPTACRTSATDFPARGGTSLAMGLPCFVMVISSAQFEGAPGWWFHRNGAGRAAVSLTPARPSFEADATKHDNPGDTGLVFAAHNSHHERCGASPA
jgi:hypothetical protein